MPDFDAINTALVARFAAAAIPPPTGYDNVKIATGDLPTGMLPLPAVLVFPEEGAFSHHPGKRHMVAQWIVRFYYNQSGDLERDTAALRKWLTVLVGQLQGAVSLGGVINGEVHITGFNVGTFVYATQDYTGIELPLELVVNEPWSPVA